MSVNRKSDVVLRICQPSTLAERVEDVKQSFVRSNKKLVRTTSHELQMAKEDALLICEQLDKKSRQVGFLVTATLKPCYGNMKQKNVVSFPKFWRQFHMSIFFIENTNQFWNQGKIFPTPCITYFNPEYCKIVL